MQMGSVKQESVNLNVKWNIDENTLPQTVLILIQHLLDEKDLYFVVVTFSTSYKTSRFLRVISELDGKKNISIL